MYQVVINHIKKSNWKLLLIIFVRVRS